jgi:hypothetical protein
VDNEGDVLTFKILRDDLTTVWHRSVVRSASDAILGNKRFTFNSDVQETRNKLDTKPSALITTDSQSKQMSRKFTIDQALHPWVKDITLKFIKFHYVLMKILSCRDPLSVVAFGKFV